MYTYVGIKGLRATIFFSFFCLSRIAQAQFFLKKEVSIALIDVMQKR